LSRTLLHWSRDSPVFLGVLGENECCRGAPTSGDWNYPGLNGSRRGCCCHEVHVIGPNVSSKLRSARSTKQNLP